MFSLNLTCLRIRGKKQTNRYVGQGLLSLQHGLHSILSPTVLTGFSFYTVLSEVLLKPLGDTSLIKSRIMVRRKMSETVTDAQCLSGALSVNPERLGHLQEGYAFSVLLLT